MQEEINDYSFSPPDRRFGETEFFQAGDGRIGYQRSLNGQTVRIYVNQSDTPWVIPGGNVLLGLHLERLAADSVTIAPMGMCILEG